MKKEKKLLVTDGKGNFGHATEKPMPNGLTFLEVRMFDDYENVHTTNWSSFLIYYEVCNEIQD